MKIIPTSLCIIAGTAIGMFLLVANATAHDGHNLWEEEIITDDFDDSKTARVS